MYEAHAHKTKPSQPAQAPEGPYVITEDTIWLSIMVPGKNGVLMQVASVYNHLTRDDDKDKAVSLAVAKLFISAKTANTACKKALERLKAIEDSDEDLKQLLQEALTMAEVA